MREHADFSSLLFKIIQSVKDLLAAEGASIFLLEGDKLVLRATTGVSDSKRNEIPVYKIGEGITGYVVKSQEPILLSDYNALTEKKEKYDEVEHTGTHLRSLIVAPIMSGDRVLGVIRCTNKTSSSTGQESEAFSKEDTHILELFARHAAAAIEARDELYLTENLPYVFVLIPFSQSFLDIYQLGIKGMVESLGMRCERVDEIEFNDSVLEQIYRGIKDADIIIAEMTGRNPNVFYEVGYAHALDKDVILLTQNAADIPFDLRSHNHIIYNGQITILRERLERRLRVWLKNNHTQ